MSRRMGIMLTLCLLLFGGVFLAKWFSQRMLNQYLDSKPIPPVSISSMAVQVQKWDRVIKAVGTLVAVAGADLTAEVDGTVTAIEFESGQHVAANQVLLRLHSSAEQGELQRLQAQAELARLALERRQDLFRRGSISKSEYDTAEAEMRAADAAVASQRGRLELKTLTAPFSGTLGIRRVNLGQFLRAGDPIVSLQSLDPIDLDFSLPERLLGVIQPGMSVVARVDALADAKFEGQISAVEPKIDTQTRNFDLRARLSNPDQALKPGLFAEASVNLGDPRAVLAIPQTAVRYSSYGDSVFVVVENAASSDAKAVSGSGAKGPSSLRVSERFVTLGEARGDFIEVSGGLQAGEIIATSGLLKLRSNQPVNISELPGPQPELQPTPPET